jgi:hypothetical protein
MSIHGFDPLSVALGSESATIDLLNQQTKRYIQSILRSYTGYYDVFSELIQNGIDALERKFLSGEKFDPTLWITIDIPGSKVAVVDNGIGMSEEEFKLCLAPSISFKNDGKLRGQKGVGATFLAYGFTFIRLQSKRPAASLAAVLRQGRSWAEDNADTIPRPTLEQTEFSVSELFNETSGTSVEIVVGKTPSERPKDLTWMGAQSGDQWLDVLRLKTPLGGVYLTRPSFKFTAKVRVIGPSGNSTTAESRNVDYYYPHEMPNQKVQAVSDISAALQKVAGDAQTKFSRIPGEHKRLDAIYEVWTADQILADGSPFESVLDDERRALIERHSVALYGCFLRSAKLWTLFNDEILKLRRGTKIVEGGLILATDGMIQGDSYVIPLTSAIGYQANSHVIVHFTNGNPDMGRKTFQPELKELAEALAVRSVTVMRRYQQHLKPDSDQPTLVPAKELYEWKKRQEEYRDNNPVSLQVDGRQLSLLSQPQQEQDVIALFHELLGMGAIKGLHVFATSSHDTYDSLFQCNYINREDFVFDRSKRPLGVSENCADNYLSEPKVLEYKYDLDAFVSDVSKDIKFEKQIDLLVCWSAGKKFKERYYLESLLVGDEGSNREVFGSTHKVYPDGGAHPLFEVIILDDLLRFFANPDAEQARQKATYSD